MPKCLFERNTALYVGGTRYDDLTHNPVTHIQLELSDFPRRREDRWDGAVGIRAATAQELTNFDDTEKSNTADGRLNTPLNMTLRDVLLDIEQRLRSAGQLSTIPEVAASNTKSDYTNALKDILKSHL